MVPEVTSFTGKTFFTQAPTMNELMIAGIIVASAVLIGIFIKRVLLVWLKKLADKTEWEGDDIVIESLQNMVEFFFLFIGLYFAVFYLPFNEKWAGLSQRFIQVALVFLVTVFVARVGSKAITLYQSKQEGVAKSTSIFGLVLKGIVYVLGGLVILQSMGISITPLLTALGVGGLAVALALQDTLSNLFAGLQILASKSIQPGDYVQLESADEGIVEDISWRTTSIRALPNRIIVIPNSKLAASTVRNFSKPDLEISVPIEVGVGYQSDLDHVEKVVIEVAKEVLQSVDGAVADWNPVVRFHTFGAYSVNFTVGLRAKEFVFQFPLKHEFVKRLHKRFKQEGIEIPFPITTIQMKKDN
ncbi:small-conductance mechanosensitive channel [Breznakibacter xylanolyticus]|uniref:Small-conductance mechanosensitive channel n=1 Tax=Breznakibacter xylanolyticus TaxID=990 RepID=A0A2W7NJE7_9BACT|nr:mechanosensitive ion channel family protein [Breznakibacter xylanolyticus]PZX20378.1 small-conductance mechanosensitive channel [Breznakibacter xylanolyticus]